MIEKKQVITNPIDGGKAEATTDWYQLGDRVKTLTHRKDFGFEDATVVDEGVVRVVSACDLWIEQSMIVEFSDGVRVRAVSGDTGLVDCD